MISAGTVAAEPAETPTPTLIQTPNASNTSSGVSQTPEDTTVNDTSLSQAPAAPVNDYAAPAVLIRTPNASSTSSRVNQTPEDTTINDTSLSQAPAVPVNDYAIAILHNSIDVEFLNSILECIISDKLKSHKVKLKRGKGKNTAQTEEAAVGLTDANINELTQNEARSLADVCLFRKQKIKNGIPIPEDGEHHVSKSGKLPTLKKRLLAYFARLRTDIASLPDGGVNVRNPANRPVETMQQSA